MRNRGKEREREEEEEQRKGRVHLGFFCVTTVVCEIISPFFVQAVSVVLLQIILGFRLLILPTFCFTPMMKLR